ncbi:cadherin-89D [Adelges cooleyi]|uniref:cadherin-89D n=1 Tax=Adelges cooleyi TaxID=133065 RepID=UPI00217F275D|nr:cadherin-89D [Adelges cooleyi]
MGFSRMDLYVVCLAILVAIKSTIQVNGCQFYPIDNHHRIVRLLETAAVGSEVTQIEVHPRRSLSLQPVENNDDVAFFKFRTINRTTISLRLARSLGDLVDRPNPIDKIKVKLVCGVDDTSASASVMITVEIEDVNDNNPFFIGAPYNAEVSESIPIGTTIVKNIRALDADKPSTPNSDVRYLIAASKSQAKFSLVMDADGSAAIILKESLNYDSGDDRFLLDIFAKDEGIPSRNTSTTVDVRVRRDESRVLKFTNEVYHSQFKEHFPITGKRIIQEILFNPPINAYYGNNALNSTIRYALASDFDEDIFHIDHMTGKIYLNKEIDADLLPSNIFLLKIQAMDMNNPSKRTFAEVEIEVTDVNDNQPKFEVDAYNVSVPENIPNGYNVLRVVATDLDQGDNGEFVYHLVDPSQAFTIDGKTGWITVRNHTKLDREQKSSFSLRVYAREKIPFVIQQKETGDAFVSVEVTLLDINDNSPVFVPSNQYFFTTRVNVPVKATIGKVEAVDPDEGINGRVLYKIPYVANNDSDIFGVNSDTGELFAIVTPLNPGKLTVIVNASDQPLNPSEMRYSLAVVTINVLEEEITNPDFVNAPYEFWVGSDVPVGTSVGQIRVVSDNSNVDYDLLHTYKEGVPFAVEEKSGTISVVEVITNFERTDYEFEAVATDHSHMTITTNVTIHIVYSDSSQTLTKTVDPISLVFRIRENLPGIAVGRLGNTDTSNSTNMSKPKFIVADPDDGELFTVSEDGVLFTKSGLDRETKESYKLTVIADRKTKTGIHHATIFQIRVIVEDENDNAPEFQKASYEGSVLENSLDGTLVNLNAPIKTFDRDFGPNSMYSLILQGEGSEMFTINKESGTVTVSNFLLDRETRSVYHLKIVATDRGNLSSVATLSIRVIDVNDNVPSFTHVTVYPNEKLRVAVSSHSNISVILGDYTVPHRLDNSTVTLIVWLPETIQPGSPVLAVQAEDADTSVSTITYKLARSGMEFAVHPVSGQLSVVGQLKIGEQELNVTAEDGDGLMTWILLTVYVEEDLLFQKRSFEFWVPEGSYKQHEVGCLTAEETSVSYSLSRRNYRNPIFSVTDGGCLTVSGDLDRETRDSYDLRLSGKRKSGGTPSTVDIIVKVLDINDNAPQFRNHHRIRKLMADEIGLKGFEGELTVPVYEVTLTEVGTSGTVVTRIVAEDPDGVEGGNSEVEYSLFGSGAQYFEIDRKTGVVTLKTPLLGGIYNVTVIASDSGTPRKDNAALLVVSVADKNLDAEEPLLELRYLEVEVEENCLVPLEILKLNVTPRYRRFASSISYTIIPSEHSESFEVDSKNGNVYIIDSPDREITPTLTVVVQVDVTTRKGKSSFAVHSKGQDIALNEARIVLKVLDQNDNSPSFINGTMPVIAAVSSSTSYGTPVITVQATDPDAGINSDIRYEMVGASGENKYFSVDSHTGLIRTIGGLSQLVNNTVLGFDVRATDRAGASDGRSAITNVFVYVLDERKVITMAMAMQPSLIEKHTELVTNSMSNITGCTVKIWKIDANPNNMTDILLYAVDPITNELADSDLLMNLMLDHQTTISNTFKPLHFVGFSRMPKKYGDVVVEHSFSLYTTIELLTVLFGFFIFMGAIIGVACVCTGRRKEKKNNTLTYGNFGFHEGYPFTLSDGSLARLSTCEPRSLVNPTSFVEGSVVYGGAVMNPKHLRRGVRCNQTRSLVPTEPPSIHNRRPQCGTRSDPDNCPTDFCSCSSTTCSTGTASLTRSFVLKSNENFEDSLRSMPDNTSCQRRHHRCNDDSNTTPADNINVCMCPTLL